jgi:hypothetical protein
MSDPTTEGAACPMIRQGVGREGIDDVLVKRDQRRKRMEDENEQYLLDYRCDCCRSCRLGLSWASLTPEFDGRSCEIVT